MTVKLAAVAKLSWLMDNQADHDNGRDQLQLASGTERRYKQIITAATYSVCHCRVAAAAPALSPLQPAGQWLGAGPGNRVSTPGSGLPVAHWHCGTQWGPSQWRAIRVLPRRSSQYPGPLAHILLIILNHYQLFWLWLKKQFKYW